MKKLIQSISASQPFGNERTIISPSITGYQMLRILLIPLVLIFIAFEQSGSIHSLLEIIDGTNTVAFLTVIVTILIIAWLGHLGAHHAIDRLGDPVLLQPVVFKDSADEPPPMPAEGS